MYKFNAIAEGTVLPEGHVMSFGLNDISRKGASLRDRFKALLVKVSRSRRGCTWLRRIVLLTAAFYSISSAQLAPANDALPRLAGAYQTESSRPAVFTTPAELRGLAQRINRPNSYSALRFLRLAEHIKGEMAVPVAWDGAYSGCRVSTYLYAFSIESVSGANEQEIRSDLNIAAERKRPAGAAVVAAQLALYAALIKAGVSKRPEWPNPDQAAALAKQIMIAWAANGFRDQGGKFRTSPKQFCDDDEKITPESQIDVGLHVARGVLYSVQSQDLLMYLNVLNPEETRLLDDFHRGIRTLLLSTTAYNAANMKLDCNLYGNHNANQLAASIALARLFDDKVGLEAILYGGSKSSSGATLPWIAFFNRSIYGESDTPNNCFHNSGNDGYSSRPFFSTSVVVRGEIDDRFRNADDVKAIGYSMFTLERLFDAAEALKNAGFEPYIYRGVHRQSLEDAVQYYACFAQGAGFSKVINSQNSANCPNFAQYDGKLVNGVDRMILLGSYRFPGNVAITSLEESARTSASSGAGAFDPILFGQWRD